jgi:hypothetical protein
MAQALPGLAAIGSKVHRRQLNERLTGVTNLNLLSE